MKRTPVLLTNEQASLLEKERQRLGVSTATVIRQALDMHLGIEREPKKLWFIGLGRSGHHDTARNMEELLAQKRIGVSLKGTLSDPTPRDVGTIAKNRHDAEWEALPTDLHSVTGEPEDAGRNGAQH